MTTSARDMNFTGDYQEVVEFYRKLRQLLYKRVSGKYSQFQATPISYDDCIMADKWAKIDPVGRNDWRWQHEYPGYQKTFKRFDIAFKKNRDLVSLSYGVPTAHNTGMKVNIIESTPIKEHKLLGVKGFELISYAAQVYAAMVGADEIRIMRPSSNRVRDHYCSMGYEFVSTDHKPSLPNYCVMKLR